MKGRVFVSKLFFQISIHYSLRFYHVIKHISTHLIFIRFFFFLTSSSFCCGVLLSSSYCGVWLCLLGKTFCFSFSFLQCIFLCGRFK